MRIEIDLFSGRPNPSWEATPAERAEILRLLENLPIAPLTPAPEALGYRGFIVTDAGDDLRIIVHQGVVWKGDAERHSCYEDRARTLEKTLLAYARPYIDAPLLAMLSTSIASDPR